jgi:TRAP-type C4-dicarboxylate transport system permease small subunit
MARRKQRLRGWGLSAILSAENENRFELALRRLNDLLADIGIICLVALTLLISLNILMRYFLNAPITWADEFAAYFLLGTIFLGLAYALQDGTHIKIDFLTQLLSERAQAIAALAAHCVGVFFALLLALAAYSRVHSFWATNTQSVGEFEFPLYLPALLLIIGTVMFLLVMVSTTVRLFLEFSRKN